MDPEGRLEVLFRPEDLTLAVKREELTIPVLGQGTVEQVLFLGTLQRLRLRLQPLPGTWVLPPEFGESGVPIQVARIPRSDGHLDLQVGQQVWVGINNFHILPRVPLRLLLATDESANFEALLQYGAMLAQITSGPVTVVTAAADQPDAEQLAMYARETLAPQVPGAVYQARWGRPVDEILRQQRQGTYDLQVVAEARKPSLRADAQLRELIRRSNIPTLVVKGERRALRRILFCTAGGEPGKRDIVFGGRLARRAVAQTTLLYVEATPAPHVPSPFQGTARAPAPPHQPPPWIASHLEEGTRTLLNQGITAEVKYRQGAVSEEILKEANEGDYDLIVVGQHFQGATTRLGIDLTSEILQRADRPVLIVTGDLNAFR